jgi:hypothetical protein
VGSDALWLAPEERTFVELGIDLALASRASFEERSSERVNGHACFEEGAGDLHAELAVRPQHPGMVGE